jgi:macrolide transport system ATP-binding/permease protein
VAFQAESSECLLVGEKLMTRPQKDSATSSVPAKQGQGRSSTLSFLATIRQDVRFAARQLSKSPGFAFTAILVFGLGIAASTAIFAFVDAAFVKPLPYREPSQLVALFERIPVGDRYHISYADYLDWKRQNRSFTSLSVYRPERLTFKTHSGADEVSVARVSDGFFGTLGVIPFLGRNFRSGEDQPSAPQTVILSYETWQKRFAGNRNVLGQAVTLDGTPSLIIGVLPSGFHFAPVGTAAFWITLHWPQDLDPRTGHPYYGVARLKPDASITTARADLTSIARQIALAYPAANRDRSTTVLSVTDVIVGDIRPTLMALLGGAGLLALIGFVNVASLLLVRAESRRREIAVRGALGASRARLVRQFAVEGFLLAGAGCGIGLLLTLCAISMLARQVPRDLLDSMPYLQGLHFNAHLIFFAMILSLIGGSLFSLVPVLRLFLSDLHEGLMEGGRTAAGRTWRRAGASLVVAELAITVVLLTSAGLLAKSSYRLLHEDVGMSVDHLALLHVLDQDASTDAQELATERKIRAAMAALPGSLSVGESEELVVDSGEGYADSFSHFRVVGRSYVGDGDEADERGISVGYFETLRARLLQGRFFSEEDDASKPRVALINRTMAAQIFAGEDPLGKVIVSEFHKDHPVKIIGIVDDIKDGPLDMKPTAAVYEPLNQNPTNDFYVTLRTSASEEAMLPAMVHAVHRIDSGLIANGEDTMADRINNSQAAYLHRSAAWLVAGFAALALLLGTIGLYGVIAYSVGQRTREIGVRMALGAQRSSVYQLILKEACWLTAVGVAGGVVCSVVVANLLRSLLFAVSPWDITTLLSVGFVLSVSTLIASYIPARRAASIDPAEALRAE